MLMIPDVEDNEQIRQTGENFKLGFGTTAIASGADVLVRSPVSSIFRSANLSLTQFGDYLSGQKKLTSEEFKKSEFFRPGLEFPDGVTKNVAKLVSDRKDDENERAFLIRQGSANLSSAGKVGLFATSLASALLDPINIAAGFVPVVGEARFASLVGKIGFTGARASRGVAEGAVGATLVEPLVLFAAFQEQADYTAMDSLLNIAFGSVFGGGLHVIGGKVADIVRGHTPELRELNVRTAISQVADGRSVDVELNTKVTPDAETHPVHNLEVPNREDQLAPIREVLAKQGIEVSNEEIIIRLEQLIGQPAFKHSATDKIFLKAVQESPELTKLAEILQKPGFQRTAEDLIFLRSFKNKGDPTRNKIDVDTETAKIKEIDQKIAKAEKSKAKTPKGIQANKTKIDNLKKEKKALEQKIADKESVPQVRTNQAKSSFSEKEIEADAQKTFEPRAESVYTQEAIDSVDDLITKSDKADLEQSLNDIDNEIGSLMKGGLINEDDLAEYREADQLLKNSEKMEDTINSIAVCVGRN